MRTGVGFIGIVPASASKVWQVQHWPAAWHTIWTVMPRTPVTTPAPQLTVEVETSRTTNTETTYHLNVINLSTQPTTFEARYLVPFGDDDPSTSVMGVKVVELAPA